MNAQPGAIVIEGHIQGLSNTRSLGELGVPVYVIDRCNCIARYSRFCRKFFICPPFDSKEFVFFLIELAHKENILGWLLMASNDYVVEQLSCNRDELSRYYRMLVPDRESLQSIIDKRNLMKIAKGCGINIPFTLDALPDHSINSLPFPMLVKGSRGLAFFKKTHLKGIQVNDYYELQETCNSLSLVLESSEYMIQELIESDKNDHVISFTCFADNGEVKAYWMGQKLREHPIRYGTATLAQSVFEQQVLDEATPLIRQLRYTGICEIEFMRDKKDGFYKLIEINPRTWLWVGLAKECGVDYAKIGYRYVNGIEQIYPQGYRIGLKWQNRLTDFIFAFKAILSNQLSIAEFFYSLHGNKVYAVWSWKDIMPGIVFPLMSFYIAKRRR